MRMCLSGQHRTWGLMCSKTYSLKKKKEETVSTRTGHVLHVSLPPPNCRLLITLALIKKTVKITSYSVCLTCSNCHMQNFVFTTKINHKALENSYTHAWDFPISVSASLTQSLLFPMIYGKHFIICLCS